MAEIPKWKERLERRIDGKQDQEQVTVSVGFLRGINTTLEAYADAQKAQQYYAEDLKKELEDTNND